MREILHMGHDPIREFDAHIYYSLESRSEALALRERFSRDFARPDVRVGRLIDRPIGPHPLPMFEVNFKKERFEEIQLWLNRNRGPHTVLIHEVTGDDIRDHTRGATWLGSPVDLDFSQLEPAV